MCIRQFLMFLSCAAMFGASHAKAQWISQSQDTVSRVYNQVFMLNGQTGWITGDYGSILKTTDGGKIWTIQHSDSSWFSGIAQIAFVDSSVGFALGSSNGVNLPFRTTNGGTTWLVDSVTFKALIDSSYFVTDLVVTRSGNSSLACISFIGTFGPGKVNRDFYATTDRGVSWHMLNMPPIPNKEIAYVVFPTPSTTLVTTVDMDSIYRSTDGGQSWQTRYFYQPANSYAATFRFLNPDTGYFAGPTNGNNPITSPTTIGWTYDGGLTWSLDTNVALYRTHTGQPIWFLNRQRGVAITSKIGSIFETTDGGTTWSEFIPTNAFLLQDIGSADGRTVVAVGTGSEILVSNDSAVTWNDLTPPNKLVLTQVHYLSNGIVTAIGDGDGLYVSLDSGKTWTKHPMPSGFNVVVDFGDTLSCWIADGSSRIYHSSDLGLTWEFQNEQYISVSHLYGINFLNDSVGCAVGGDGYVIWTNNGGRNWNPGTIPFFSDSLYSAFIATPTRVWTVGGVGAIFCSSDGFKTWVRQTSPARVALRYVSFADSLNGYILGDGGVILKTTDGGTTWNLAQSPSSGLNAMKFVVADTGWVVGSGGKIFNTVNGGAGWTAQRSDVTANLLSVDFANKDNGIILADDGTVLTTTNGGNVMAVNPGKLPVSAMFRLSQNYPNPFNPSTTISYELSANSFVSLKVYDVLGREVGTLVNERETTGTHSAKFDGAALPSGVYFYRINAGSYISTKKMLLLK